MGPSGGVSSASGEGSKTSLARLAVDTGGRFTERTNDLTAGYTRAASDLSCVYTLGFYVDEPEENRVRNVVIRVKRPGTRAIHPSRYVFRSPGKKRESLLLAAWNAPELFETGVVRAHAFPLRPVGKERWDALLAVTFTVPLGETGGRVTSRQFGAVLHDGPRLAHRFDRQISLEPEGPQVTSAPTVTFLERVQLKPGRFTLTAVMSDPSVSEMHATKVEVEIPEIPQKELFLVGPILGRPAALNLVVTGGGAGGIGGNIGERNSFEPLLVHQLDEPVDLAAFTQACLFSKKRRKRVEKDLRISRALRDPAGQLLGDLPDQDLRLEGDGPLRCQNLVDRLPVSSLADGEYVFEARVDSAGRGSVPSRVQFAVGIPSEDLTRADGATPRP